jgi:hypothetical protein
MPREFIILQRLLHVPIVISYTKENIACTLTEPLRDVSLFASTGSLQNNAASAVSSISRS